MPTQLTPNEYKNLHFIQSGGDGDSLDYTFAFQMVGKGLLSVTEKTARGSLMIKFKLTKKGKQALEAHKPFEPFDENNAPNIRDSAKVWASGKRNRLVYNIERKDRNRVSVYNATKITPSSRARLSRLLWGRSWTRETDDSKNIIWSI